MLFRKESMEMAAGRNKIKYLWESLPVEKKLRFIGLLFPLIIIAMSLVFISTVTNEYSKVGDIISDITRCSTAQEAMHDEREALENFMREPSGTTRKNLDQAETHTRSSISQLHESYDKLGDERYAKLWNIQNAYSVYEKDRDAITSASMDSEGAVQRLYRVYDEADYLEVYIQSLTQMTIEQGGKDYNARADWLNSIPVIMLLLSAALALAVSGLWGKIAKTMSAPMHKIVKEMRRIGAGDFSGKDISVSNKDEIGELVDTVNTMKHQLEKSQQLSDRLHEEEMKQVQTARALDSARLDLLYSQVNPHFLFNTLNVISGMAELENAATTEKMIRSLSGIFRYNLHTTTQMVSLTQEIQVLRDYMYLQQMRFGSRLEYQEDFADTPTDTIIVPVFLLQPLVENAVVHGITKKEEGGRITLRIRQRDGNTIIVVEDNGVGMSREAYLRLSMKLQQIGNGRINAPDASEGEHSGVGLGNVYERILRIYPKGNMIIRTKEGQGMTVELVLPQGDMKDEQV